MQYTTGSINITPVIQLCHQDFKDTFVCNTQHNKNGESELAGCVIRISKILLYAIHNQAQRVTLRKRVVSSGFQRYFCMQYTTPIALLLKGTSCVIRISKILLYAIHNFEKRRLWRKLVVSSGFQRYFCMQYTTGEFYEITD